MKRTKFEHPFQLSTRSLDQASILDAAGHYVECLKQAASARRCIFYADDCIETRDLLSKFEARQPLQIAAKEILLSRTELHHRALCAVQESL
jgi:hypothetical protein